MSDKRKGDDSSSATKKKIRTYQESYINLGFTEGTDKTRPECVICGEKLANDSMKPSKMKRHQETKHPETVGKDRDFDETTTVADEAVLVVYVQYIDCEDLKQDILMSVNLTTTTRVKIVNFIKGRPTNKRLFADLCEDEAHQTLLLHTEVRWLSRGRVLVRFVELQEKIEEFLQTHNPALSEKVTESFWIKTAYLADIFSLYNETNKRLQGAESNIMQCKEALDAFVRKLEYRVGKMERGELQQFPLLLKQCRNNPETVPGSVRREFTRHMNALQKEIKSRFADTDDYVSKELWVLDPFIVKVEDVEYLDCEDELTDIQADSLSKKYFQEQGFKKFWDQGTKHRSKAHTACHDQDHTPVQYHISLRNGLQRTCCHQNKSTQQTGRAQ
ncbi:hypothetical protein SKAU_G00276310 [Synaphobranchus kaupii]|uniref:Uncharacterized protein n=1 Tax=Synaphobranchus kaupii TaxID=118154 RepID=A0A9Q1F1A9_SYNKA|nr:hypothetical protein SKAU_G00276310 [Synaphobranchus kaupii]